MAALDFPASPTNGQVYQNWIYSTSKGAWQAKPMVSAKTVTADVAPSNPANGDEWLNTLDGCLYIYYVDVDGGQWVQVKNDASFSSELGPTVDALNAGANTNYIINGAFDIWQRGTSATSTGYLADRWKAQVSGTCTHSQESTVVPDGARYSYKWITGASSSYGQIRQWIETATVVGLRGKTLTASAYVKVSAGFTGTIGFEIAYSTTTDTESGFNGTAPIQTATTSSSTSWTRITSTFVVPSNAVGLYIAIVPSVVQASGVTVYMGNIQLQEGTKATAFHRAAPTLQGELAACQRYYFRINSATQLYTYYGMGNANSATGASMLVKHEVPMRTKANSFEYSQLAACRFGITHTALSTIVWDSNVGSESYTGFNTSFATYGVTAGDSISLIANGSTSSYLGISAEL